MEAKPSHQDLAALDVVPTAVLVVNRSASIVYANRCVERLFGYSTGSLAGRAIEVLIPERFRTRHSALFRDFFSSPSQRPMGSGRELVGLLANGTELPIEIALGPTDGGTHVVVVVHDLSGFARARLELQHSEQRFRAAAESVADLIWEGDAISNTLVWFGDFDGLLGYEQGEIPRTIDGWLSLIHPDDVEAVQYAIQRAIETCEYKQPDYRIRCKDGSYRFWEDRGVVTAVVDGRGTRAVGAITDVTERIRSRQELELALSELARLKDRLQAESDYLRAEIKSEHNFEEIIGSCAVMRAMLHKVEQVAATDSSVLLLGETGTGKELLARGIHSRSMRRDRPLIKVDCSTLPPGLIESELFGHEKGAFTGAHGQKTGRFELADSGTIFLDEVGELPLELQSKLLRVLEDGMIERLGSGRERTVDVRVIAATNRDLQTEIREGRFRADLFYRLGVFPIDSPPLRERREDIPLLVSFLVTRATAALGKAITSVSQAAMDALVAYDWPGNVRELKNVIERSVILCPGDTLEIQEALGDIPTPIASRGTSLKQNIEEVERANILHALETSGWKIKGRGNAAERLGLKPSTLRSRMKRLGINRP